MERQPGNAESAETRLIRKYQLLAGNTAAFEKIAVNTGSPIPVGSTVEGKLASTLRVGEPITFENNSAAISNIKGIEETNGDLLIHTNTSTYRVRQEGSHQQTEDFDLEDVASVETAKGSVYRYLPDGTTQRFKKVEGKEYDPQAALVYVPDYAWVQKNAPPETLAKLGDNETQYIENLLEYVHWKGRSMYIIDKSGKKLESNQDIESAEGPVYLAFLSDDKVDFYIPVSHKPKMGYSTFDTRKYYDKENDQWMRDRHLGNKVVKINLKEKDENAE